MRRRGKNGDNFIYDNLPGYQYFDITCDVCIVINDQHPIKQRFFSEFLKQNNIKQKFRQSYSPQPQEATNRVLRNTMRAKFIQPGKLIRKPCINDLWKPKLLVMKTQENLPKTHARLFRREQRSIEINKYKISEKTSRSRLKNWTLPKTSITSRRQSKGQTS